MGDTLLIFQICERLLRKKKYNQLTLIKSMGLGSELDLMSMQEAGMCLQVHGTALRLQSHFLRDFVEIGNRTPPWGGTQVSLEEGWLMKDQCI